MPTKPKRKCNKPGCRELTSGRYCEKCDQERQRLQDRQRGTAHERGYNGRWRKARATYLQRNPLCVECKQRGKLVAATVVDHRVPHKGDQDLFWDTSNWQALCKPCHDRKTVREDGGWGNGRS